MNYDDTKPPRSTPEEYEEFVKHRDEYHKLKKTFVRDISDNEQRNRMYKMNQSESYFKGEILPMINHLCRTNMTTGDIDGFATDYYKKMLLFFEQKRPNERCKESQDKFMRLLVRIFNAAMSTNEFKDWHMGVYKVTGNPPFNESEVYNYQTNESKTIEREDLIAFMQMHKTYDSLKELEYNSTHSQQVEIPF